MLVWSQFTFIQTTEIGSISALVLLINKASSEFRQTLIRVNASEPTFNYEGTCQLDK